MGNGKFYANLKIVDQPTRSISLTADEKNLVNLIGERIYNMRIGNKTNERVLELNKQFLNTEKLKQWGTLKDFFLYLSRLSIKEGKETYRNYMGHIVEKRGKSYKDMERVYYITPKGERQSLRKFFDDYMENITDMDYFEVYMKTVKWT